MTGGMSGSGEASRSEPRECWWFSCTHSSPRSRPPQPRPMPQVPVAALLERPASASVTAGPVRCVWFWEMNAMSFSTPPSCPEE